MQTNADCTIYNQHPGPGRLPVWVRHQIEDVQWENRKAVNKLSSGGNIAADQAAIYIPFTSGTGYTDPRSWEALEDKTSAWTLRAEDVIVKGLIEDEITPDFTLTDLKNKYNDVLEITSVDRMDMGSRRLHHWQVGAK